MNLVKIYELLKQKDKNIHSLYNLANNQEEFAPLDQMLLISGLTNNQTNRLALLIRLIALREDSMVVALEQEGKNADQIEEIKAKIYLLVSEFHLCKQEEFLSQIKEYLSPFYAVLLHGVFDIGEILSATQPQWDKLIINTANKSLFQTHKSDEEVMKYLRENHLFEYDKEGVQTDRSYSVLHENNNTYEVKSYFDSFAGFTPLVARIEGLIKELMPLSDPDFDQKEAYVTYFQALKNAFEQSDVKQLLSFWQDVDRAWMKITGPVQVGHPLEYYEDKYRKAVALEWDVRLDNPSPLSQSKTRQNILDMFEKEYFKLSLDKNIYERCVANVQKAGLHIGRPMFYFAAEFNGLFSAQVVPNDEIVSREMGKKIFAFSDNILDSSRAKPFLKINKEIFGKEFLNYSREILFTRPDIWHQIYDIETIGHEFGHTLWLDGDTELKMNTNGAFKLIEEFKATSGGLMAYFHTNDSSLEKEVITELIKRAVGLIAWKQTTEVMPYYTEGLIHLSGLFASHVLKFEDQKLKIDMSKISELKQWYKQTYAKLAKHYLDKKDAFEFLSDYAKKDENGFYMPEDQKVHEFVAFYWDLYQKMGREIDQEDRQYWLDRAI